MMRLRVCLAVLTAWMLTAAPTHADDATIG